MGQLLVHPRMASGADEHFHVETCETITLKILYVRDRIVYTATLRTNDHYLFHLEPEQRRRALESGFCGPGGEVIAIDMITEQCMSIL